jgi:hypothetical protein
LRLGGRQVLGRGLDVAADLLEHPFLPNA